MSAEDKDAEEVEEASSEKKPKRRGLRSGAKPPEESAAEEKPKRGRRAKAKAAGDDGGDAQVDGEAEPKAEATTKKTESTAKSKTKPEKSEVKPKAESKPKADGKPSPEAKAASEAKAAPEAKPKSQGEAEPKPEAKPKPRDEAKRKDKPKGGPDSEASEAPAEPQPAPRRRAPEPGGAPAVVRAHAKYVRTSARKARLVCDHIRGKSVDEARAILAFAPRAAARDWGKLLESAVANAEHNHELVGDDLRIKDVFADEGPTLKRYRPRAMGRATRIRKRTSHLTITLTQKGN